MALVGEERKQGAACRNCSKNNRHDITTPEDGKMATVQKEASTEDKPHAE